MKSGSDCRLTLPAEPQLQGVGRTCSHTRGHAHRAGHMAHTHAPRAPSAALGLAERERARARAPLTRGRGGGGRCNVHAPRAHPPPGCPLPARHTVSRRPMENMTPNPHACPFPLSAVPRVWTSGRLRETVACGVTCRVSGWCGPGPAAASP